MKWAIMFLIKQASSACLSSANSYHFDMTHTVSRRHLLGAAAFAPLVARAQDTALAPIFGQPGKDVIAVVPSEDTLLLEAKVLPRDIAFLRPGQPALVKFTAYDFAIYGGLDATLEHIGADSMTDDKGNSYFLVRVRTQNAYLEENGKQLPIIPGMVAEVDILTGKKTVLSYLLKPVLRAKAAALRER